MIGKYWDRIQVWDGPGPQHARNNARTGSAAESSLSKIQDLLEELKALTASKSRSDAMVPPSDARVGQVYRLQHSVVGDPGSDLVLGWGYMDEFHYMATNGQTWKLYVQGGELKAEFVE